MTATLCLLTINDKKMSSYEINKYAWYVCVLLLVSCGDNFVVSIVYN